MQGTAAWRSATTLVRIRPVTLLAHWPAAAAVALTVVLGIPTLIFPLGPDQALFAYMGEHLAHGARLYVDVWDVKPPGIFWIYALVTGVAGIDAQVIRAYDVLHVAAVAVALYAYCTLAWNRLAGGVAAGLYGAVYVSATGYWHSAQPDSFAALPLLLGMIAYDRAQTCRGGPRLGLLAGVFFGLCVQLRPVIVFVPLALAAVDLIQARDGRGAALRRVAGLAAGGALVQVLTMLWLLAQGALGEYFYAQLDFASQYGRQGGPYSPDGLTLGTYLSGLRTGTMFIFFARLTLTVPAVFAFVAGVMIVRERRVTQLWLLLLAAWLGVAVQGKFFLYHWHLVLLLCAPLAGWSAAWIWSGLRQAGRGVAASAATLAGIGVLLLVLTPDVTDRAVRNWTGFVNFYRDPDTRTAYYDRFGLYARGSFSYRASEEASAYVRSRTREGDTIFVWGYDPLMYVLSERDSASRFTSFLPLMSTWTPQRWVDEFVDDLEAKRPVYIITQRGENARFITGHSIDAVDYIPWLPRFHALLTERYEPERRIEDYQLYRLKDAP